MQESELTSYQQALMARAEEDLFIARVLQEATEQRMWAAVMARASKAVN